MTTEIAMPQLGLTMTEGSVSAWLKKAGDSVRKDEIVLVVSTDKVDMDIECPADGTLKEILVEAGETVAVGTTLALVETEGAGQSDSAPPVVATKEPAMEAARNLKPTMAAESTSASREGATRIEVTGAAIQEERRNHIVASPRAKKVAMELGIDLATVKGSGPQGRIAEDDVRAAASKKTERPKGTNRRQIIADRMVESITTIPAFSVSLEVNAENLVQLYGSMKNPIAEAAGVKLTYTDLLLKALAISLQKTPELNAVWDSGEPRALLEKSVSVAVATERGVVAPTLVSVDRLSLDAVVKQRSELTTKARESRLSYADMEAAAGTLSNLGMYRVDRFQGIITPGQTFILAVGSLRNRPWVDTTLTVKPTMVLNLSVDHRVADGAAAAVFLERIAEVIENPYQILWNAEQR